MKTLRPSARPESGFLLIGVVMFVLALTILGISLYSLSSYEADFQGRSRDSNQAFYLGQGGTEMVLKLLQQNWNLNDAQDAVTHQGVDSVYVSQPNPGGGLRTSGPMNDSTVTVTVVTSVRGVSRRLVGKYRPARTTSYYTRLFTVGDGGIHGAFNAFAGSVPTYVLTSTDTVRTWTNDSSPADADVAWGNFLQWQQPKAMRLGGVPAPDVQGFLAEYAGPPYANPGFSQLLRPKLTFDPGASTGPVYYEVQGPVSSLLYSILTPLAGLDLDVRGTAIWIVPQGLFCLNDVHVRSLGGQPATLVVVAPHTTGRPPGFEYDLYLQGGLDVDPLVNVIMVTDGLVFLEQEFNYSYAYDATHLSIYCNHLTLRGPGSPVSHLAYDPAMTPIIRALEQSGDLPSGGSAPPSSFVFVSGSWRDVTP